MIYTKNYFGKEKIEDITYEDVVNFFSEERQESDKIEFKSFVTSIESNRKGDSIKEKESGVIKSISGFLNSEGGLLIWGAPTGKNVAGKKEKVFIGELSLVEQLYEKDQLISKLTDSITPIPRGVLFHRIENEEKYIYLLETPKSEYSPHQYKDGFYMRIDGQTKPAPYHYIEALFKKIKYPNLNGYIKPRNWQLVNNQYIFDFSVIIFNHSKLQNDFNLLYRLICDMGTFIGHESTFRDKGVSYLSNGQIQKREHVKDVIHYGEPITMNERIKFNPSDLQLSRGQFEIILAFGAKYSPMKTCIYKFQSNQDKPKNLHSWIIEKEENKLISDNNISDKEQVEALLGREIDL